MIEVKSIHKNYENIKAVENLSMSVNPGEIYGIIGPNGAGKSTTLRMILNIISCDQGEILFDGKTISEDDKNRIGYLPEERGLYKKSDVKSLLRLLGELKGCERSFLDKRINYWLERFDLLNWKDRKAEELSKGMAQKIQFISSIIHEPEIIILDEPFSGLDPVSSDELRDIVAELKNDNRVIIFCTHIMEQAEKICDKILLLNKGKVVVQGPLDQVKREHGSNSVYLEFDGDGDFLKSLPQVVKLIQYPRAFEIELIDEPGASDELLKRAVEKLSISRFEIKRPSLHKIFIDMVGKGEIL
ncbi:MAG: ATP-binding cassette domain-containing protein [Spirochaetales bacterium]|nr:ATP-binding cassette domain-containing protein [Spirochaetales bacterium]